MVPTWSQLNPQTGGHPHVQPIAQLPRKYAEELMYQTRKLYIPKLSLHPSFPLLRGKLEAENSLFASLIPHIDGWDFHYFLSLDIWSFHPFTQAEMPWYLCYSPCKGRIRLSVHFLTTYYSLLANTYFSLELRTPQSNCHALPVLSMGGVEDLREVDLVAVWGSRDIPRGGVVRQSVPATGCETEERAAEVASSCC